MVFRHDFYPHRCLPARVQKFTRTGFKNGASVHAHSCRAVKNRGLLNRARYAIADTDR